MVGVKAIIPKKVDVDAMNKAWLEELSAYGKFLVRDFEKVVEPWKGAKPSFSLARNLTANGVTLVVRIGGSDEGKKKWLYLDQGTKPHKIRPKNAKILFFPSAYSSGSTPGKIRTYPATSGERDTYAKEVDHPGTEARHFGDTIRDEHERPFERWMKAASVRVAEASGHAIGHA